MKLSIIIVSYNVLDCLQTCIASIKSASADIETELIIIDNNSTDGSADFLKSGLSLKENLIINTENLGYAKACNQGIRIANGEYVLLLNPDTILENSSLSTVIAFMDKHSEAGASGVKMLNNKGQYLPESKRGVPSLWNSFTKFSGLCYLFPKSKLFAGYYLGHLSEQANAPVDVLTGAFMCIRKSVFVQTGLFDEDYFMYGEDVDFSLQVQKAGYKNYYLADTFITHLKGESTRRSKLKKNFHFYNAMKIFIKKHYHNPFTRSLILLLICCASVIRPAKQ